MFKKRPQRGAGTTALAPGRRIIEPSEVVRLAGERALQMLWPVTGAVQATCALPPVIYDEDDLWCVIENLVGRALSSGARDGDPPLVLVGARLEGSTTIFSVHTEAGRAFSGQAAADGAPGSPSYRVWDAKAVVERNGGRFWLDDRNGHGSTAYFTIHC
jgi:hypothetical protein